MVVVMIDELGEDRLELASGEDQHSVEPLSTNGADTHLPSGLGQACRWSGPIRLDDLIEASRELGVTIPHQESGSEARPGCGPIGLPKALLVAQDLKITSPPRVLLARQGQFCRNPQSVGLVVWLGVGQSVHVVGCRQTVSAKYEARDSVGHFPRHGSRISHVLVDAITLENSQVGARMRFSAPTRSGCRLHTLLPGTATLAVGPGDQVDALAVASTRLTDWRLDASVGSWSKIGP